MKSFYFIFLLLVNQIALSQIITTVAGNGTYGNAGNGGLAASAQLAWQMGVTSDNSGNIYIADHDNNLIKKVDNNGIITTITGNLLPGYSGDGGPLMAAQFESITGIAFDNSGNMFISDAGNYVVRKVNTAGIISTVAGTGTSGFSGDGGAAITAQLGGAYAVVFDNVGNMYIPDNGNSRIRKVSASGIITTYAGIGVIGYSGDGGPAVQASLGYPWTIDLDNAGNLYIGDAGSNVVRKVDINGIITTYAGNGVYGNSGDGGLATSAMLGEIASVHLDAFNNLLISVRNYFFVIRKVNNCQTPNFNSQPSNDTLCNSGNAVFNVTAANAISYQWQEKTSLTWNNILNNSTYAGADTNTLTIAGVTTAMSNYQYRCMITNACGNIYSANAILTVTTPATPTLNIATSSDTICQGTMVTFTSIAGNAGNTPIYQWKKNGINVGTNSNTYNNNGLLNGDVISCVLTSGAACLVISTAVSNNIAITVKLPVAANIVVNASAGNICSGTNVSFNAVITNGGASPIYQWKKNTVNIGINAANYSDNGLNNGDLISCELTSSQGCLVSTTVASNNISTIVNPLLTPAISISSAVNNVCAGVPVTFNAVVINSGTSLSYQWKKNGMNVGINAATFTDSILTSADIISCSILVSGGCFTSPLAISNTIQLNIFQPVLPTVIISNANTSVCMGDIVKFTSAISNATASVTYQWMKNGMVVGNNTSAYSDNNILNGDVVQLNVTTKNNANCIAVTTVKSNTIGLIVLGNPIVLLDHTSTLCNGGARQLDAGSFTAYQWNDGTVQRQLTITKVGTYYVTVKDNNGCKGSDTVKITRLLPKPANFLPGDTAICPYDNLLIKPTILFRSYLWNTGVNSSSLSITNSGEYWLQAEDNNGCIGLDTIIVFTKDCLKGFFMPTAFSPNSDGRNDVLKPILLGNVKSYQFSIYNRWGQLVFKTTELGKGWNGSYEGRGQNGNVFVWICAYQFEDGLQRSEKGTVVLIR